MQTILVPGAWMGAWCWLPVTERLSALGVRAHAVTLEGLEDDTDPVQRSRVRLADHVAQLCQLLAGRPGPVVLVGHSYSSMVTAQAADRMPGRVAGLVHLGGFLPVDGRSLIDAWGGSDADRAAERGDIRRGGDLWAPPTAAMLAHEPDLTAEQAAGLAARFVPHPGHTVLDPAVLAAPVGGQPTTYVALSTGDEQEAWEHVPEVARQAAGWRRRHLVSGHFANVTQPQQVSELIAAEVAHYLGSVTTG